MVKKMIIRFLTEKDKQQYFNLIHEITSTLKVEEWFLPFKQEAINHFFDENWTRILGCFSKNIEDKEILIASCSLFTNEFEWKESAKAIDLNLKNIAEIGRCMVLPAYRGQNLMYKLNFKLLELARSLNIKNVIATAHPDNKASCKSLEKLGMIKVKTILKHDRFIRNIYLLSL